MPMRARIFYIIVLFLPFFLFYEQGASAASFNAGGVRITKDVQPLSVIKRKNVVGQSLDFSCGAAGLSTLLHYYLDDPVTEQEIIERLLAIVPIEKVRERKGFSLFDLKKFSEERGYDVTGYQMDFAFLKKLDVPVLVPIRFRNYSHFVVVRGIVGDRVFLADPAAGNVSMKSDQFERIWVNGIGLVLRDNFVPDDKDDYALRVEEDDLLIMNYAQLQKLMSQAMVRTAVFPSEF